MNVHRNAVRGLRRKALRDLIYNRGEANAAAVFIKETGRIAKGQKGGGKFATSYVLGTLYGKIDKIIMQRRKFASLEELAEFCATRSKPIPTPTEHVAPKTKKEKKADAA